MRLSALDSSDSLIRAAAFEHVRNLNTIRDHLTADDLKAGFFFNGERIALTNPQRGIFKPKQMRYLLSIKTVFPRPGARVWYDDQRTVHRQIFESSEIVDYAFMGTDPDAADNRHLREAYENRVPIIYFIGTSPGRYLAFVDICIAAWNRQQLKAQVAFSRPARTEFEQQEEPMARRYALRVAQQRLHQDSFRAAVISAYDGRCALSGLPEQRLLDAAHIIEDKHETLGHPIVPNGLPLSKIHHAAFDAHLLGIDPDFRIHVSEQLMIKKDGPMLEALKRLDGTELHKPSRKRDWPDRERLALRFDRFQAMG